MKILNLVQGSEEWHAHRATARNASEAPAVMGFSKYKTRSQLLREKALCVVEDVDAATQKRFDDGHAAEAAARPNIEATIDGPLYPVTATSDDDYLSASFDGITMDEGFFWENKLFNQTLAAYIEANNDLPDSHWPQVEQQFMVSKADECLFTLCDTNGNIKAQLPYQSRPERQAAVLAAWKQFDEDLANYQHVEAAPEVVAAPVVDLPAVSVQVSGAIAIIDNFEVFEVALRDFIDNRLIRKPETDQDFADLDTQIKSLKKAEDALNQAEAAMLSQVASIDAMKRTKDMLHKLARDNRLMAEKLLEAEKVNRRNAIQQAGKDAYAAHVAALNERIGKPYMPTMPTDFVGVTKSKRTITSIQDAVNGELARAKIAASEVADRIELNLKSLRELAKDHAFLFSDTPQLVLKPNDDLVNLIKLRINEHEAAEKAKLEAQREQIRQEEEAKAKAEAEAKVRAEMEAKAAQERAEADAKAKAEREQAAAEKAAQQATQKPVEQPAPAPIAEAMREQVVDVRQPDQPAAAPKQPTEQQIIFAVATAFNVDFHTARGWIADLAQKVAA